MKVDPLIFVKPNMTSYSHIEVCDCMFSVVLHEQSYYQILNLTYKCSKKSGTSKINQLIMSKQSMVNMKPFSTSVLSLGK